MKVFREFFGFASLVTLVCLAVAAWDGYTRGGGLQAMWQALAIAVLLGVLEISLSFDNAVVNATVLRTMSQKWQQRFLTWGILIAVFGMRFIFPILIVALSAGLGFGEVVREAFTNPDLYAEHLEKAHVTISAFGGAFLMMVFLKYFMDAAKDVHWLRHTERLLARAGKLDSIQGIIVGTLLLLLVHYTVAPAEQLSALSAGLVGLLVYLVMDTISNLFEMDGLTEKSGAAGASAFLYLEILDASFSLDGVIGAFALTKDVVLIAAGLTIGAIFVRSLTIMMVKKGTLDAYRFLEHGAHYGIGALATIMLLSMNREVHIPELVTGLIGAGFIGLAIWSSLQANKRDRHAQLN
ncbi:hypothetical protein GCM10017783_19260 [Deinococcus piscis]|uniref:DUF475 domain-containing protein n=1 Tax=Deinococcus piscis TaxID=394230 RepID=A0ABQ3K779_9DEIO|nr:DUF475 domain-containing protein [Deinococcus piscis]GHG06817.1 hypothetical protein GCM10017783_19260 [Deinococcus piscis]